MTRAPLHYFDLPGGAPATDLDLAAASIMGYVPTTCLLPGNIVWAWIKIEADPCAGCHGPRARCGGRPLDETPDLSTEARAMRWITGGSDPIAELLKKR